MISMRITFLGILGLVIHPYMRHKMPLIETMLDHTLTPSQSSID